jgi:hypothetical protein
MPTAPTAPTPLPPLPDDLMTIRGAALDALALERCGLRGHATRHSGLGGRERVACKLCLQEVLTGRYPLGDDTAADIDALLAAVPPPPTGFAPVHRALLEALADREPRPLPSLEAILLERGVRASDGEPYTVASLTARLRDLRGFGYPVERKHGRPPVYWLGR